MFRYKSIIGDRLRARRLETQTTEAAIAVNILNRMTSLGKPWSVAVVAERQAGKEQICAQAERCNNAVPRRRSERYTTLPR